MGDAYAGRHLNQSGGSNSYELPLGFSGAPRAQLWAWQPSSLSLQPCVLEADGSLRTSATLSGSAGNAAAGATGVAPPASADYQGWNDAGTLVGTSAAKPLPVQVISGGGGGTQYADGVTNATPTGTAALGKNPSDVLHTLSLDASGNLLVAIPGSVAVTGTFWQATQPVSIAGSVAVTGPLTDAQLRASAVPVSAAALPLPAGAATETTLAALNTKFAASAFADTEANFSSAKVGAYLSVFDIGSGQWNRARSSALNADAQAAHSVGVLDVAANLMGYNGATFDRLRSTIANGLAVDVTRVQGNVAVTGTFWQATQPVSIGGTVAVSGPLTDTQLRATPVPVSGTFFQATQPVSIAATVNVAGPLTDAQLRATPVPVSGTVTTKTALTASSPTAVSVGVASASAVAANASRKGLILTNLSANTISLGFGVAAVLNSGITLPPYAVFQMDEYCFSTAVVNAIASVAASSLAVQEWV